MLCNKNNSNTDRSVEVIPSNGDAFVGTNTYHDLRQAPAVLKISKLETTEDEDQGPHVRTGNGG